MLTNLTLKDGGGATVGGGVVNGHNQQVTEADNADEAEGQNGGLPSGVDRLLEHPSNLGRAHTGGELSHLVEEDTTVEDGAAGEGVLGGATVGAPDAGLVDVFGLCGAGVATVH